MSKDIKVRLYSNSNEFKNDMRSLSNQMKNVKSEFEASRTSVDKWGNEIKQSETKIQYLNRSMDLQRQKVESLKRAHTDAAQKKGEDARETESLARRLNQATAEMNKMQNELNQTNQKLKQFGESQNVKKLDTDMGALALSMKRVESEFKLVSSSAQNFGNELKQTQLRMQTLNQQINVQQQTVSRLEQEYRRVAQAKGQDAAETKQLEVRLNEAKTSLNGFQNELTQTSQKLNQFKESQKNIKFNNDIDALSRQMRVIQTQFDQAKSSVNNFGNEIRQAQLAISTLNQQIGVQQQVVSQLEQEFNRLVQTKGRDAAETRQMEARLNQAKATLNGFQNELRRTSQSLSEFAEKQRNLRFGNDMDALSRQMKLIQAEFQQASSAAGVFGNEMRQTEVRIQSLNRQIQTQQQVVNRLEQEHRQVAQSQGANSRAAQELQTRLASAQAELNGFRNSLSQSEQSLERLRREMERQDSAFRRFGDNMNNVGNKMMHIGSGVAMSMSTGFTVASFAMKNAVQAGADFGKQMSKVQAISGATGEEFGKLKAQAMDLGAKTQFSATQAAEGMEYLALAGWKTKDIMAAMPGMLNLAAAGALELGTAADITSDIMNAFGMNAKQAGHAADVFAYAQANANTNVEQMGEALKYSAPVANQFRWTLEETAAATMAFGDSGLKGSIAGQAFASSLGRLANPTKKMRETMLDLNIEFFNSEGRMKSMPELIATLEKGTEGLSDKQRSAALSVLFGAEAYKHWAILLERGSVDLQRMTTELENSDGAAAKMAATMQENLAGAFTRFSSALETAKIHFTEGLTPALSAAADMATSLVEKWSSLDSGTQGIISTSTALGVALMGVVAVVGTLTLAVGALLAFTGPVGLAIVGVTAALGVMGIAMVAANQHADNLKKQQAEAEIVARRYGEGISAGTAKGVKGYADLYEGAKLKMLQLRNMSGEEAEKTSAEVVKAFSQMTDKVVAELETQKSKLTNAINDIYTVAGDAGKKSADKLNNEIIKRFDKDIADYKQALETVKEAHEKYKGNLAEMPADFAKAYQEALKVMDAGSQEFAASQKELQAIQKSIADKQGKVLAEEAQQYTKGISDTYAKSVKAANKYYSDKKAALDQGLAQGKIFQKEYDESMVGLEASFNQMLSNAAQERTNALSLLANNLDQRGKLIDVATGKEFERVSKMEEIYTNYGMVQQKVLESDAEYVARWKQHTEQVLKSASDFSAKTKDQYQNDLTAFLQSTGMTREQAVQMAKQMVDDALNEMKKGKPEAEKAGKEKGEGHQKGLESTSDVNKKAGEKVSKSGDEGLSKNKTDAQKHGKEKGDNHQKGTESTVSANKSAGEKVAKSTNEGLSQNKQDAEKHGKDKGENHKKGAEVTLAANKTSGENLAKSLDSGLSRFKSEAQGHGKDKGSQHERGLKSTEGSNKSTAGNLSSGVTKTLASTTDGGGGKKAGGEFGKGLQSQQGAVRSAGTNVAGSAKEGLKTADGNPIGKGIAEGVAAGLRAGNSGVLSAAINLARGAISAAKKVLDINSPSRVARDEVGISIPEGMVVGMNNGMGVVQQAAQNLAKVAVPDFSKAAKENENNIKDFNNFLINSSKKTENEIKKDKQKALEEIKKIEAAAAKDIVAIQKNAERRGTKSQKSTKKGNTEKVDQSKQKLTAAEQRRIEKIKETSSEKIKKIQQKEASDVAKIEQNLTKDRLSSIESFISNKKQLERLSLKDEVKIWETAVKQFKEGTAERRLASLKLRDAKAALDKETFDNEKKWIEERKKLNKLSLTEELKAWEDVAKRYKKGSQERMEAEQQVGNIKKQIYEELKKAGDDYLAKVQDLNQKLIDEEQKLNDEYLKAVDQRTQAIRGFAGLFDEITEKEPVMGETLLSNIEGQVVALEAWSTNMQALAKRGIDEGLLAELEAMGPRASAEITALVGMSNEQLAQFETLWKTKTNLARQQAVFELEGMKKDTEQKIKELHIRSKQQLDELHREFVRKINTLRIGTENEFDVMSKTLPVIGKNAIQGVIEGMESMRWALVAKAQDLARSVEEAMQEALDINSPSRVMKNNVGKWIPIGLAEGIEGNISSVIEATKKMAQAAIPNISSTAHIISNAADTIRSNSNFLTVKSIIQSPDLESKLDKLLKLLEQSQDREATVNHYNMKFYSPKALDPYETARMNRMALREMAMKV
ncbi:phage tail tape measure protein [Metabacillus fastidiosus]|uniref:phage tail tape measure protein n=1 Tax=Metabacillus fastidiosus TaxID=1458 RepID=UPI003D26F729